MHAVGGTGDGCVLVMLLLLLLLLLRLLAHGGRRLSVSVWKLDPWRCFTGAVVDVVSTGLTDTGLGELTVILIDGSLHLLEDLVDGGQITTGFGVAHWWETVALERLVAVVSPCTTSYCRDGLVSRDGRQGRLSDQWQLKTLKLVQPLADVLIAQRIEATSLDLTEEIVESLETSLAGFEIIHGCLLRGCGCVVHVAIRRVGSLMRMLRLVILVGSLRMATIKAPIGIDGIVICGWTCVLGREDVLEQKNITDNLSFILKSGSG